MCYYIYRLLQHAFFEGAIENPLLILSIFLVLGQDNWKTFVQKSFIRIIVHFQFS